jgi:RNA polymerase sigma factor (sigma-70 family)
MATNATLSPESLTTIRVKVAGLIGRYGLTDQDFEDLHQEVALYVLAQLPHFDPQRSSLATFVSRCCDRAITRILRARRAPKRRCARDYACTDELHGDGADGYGEELAHAVAQCEERQRDLRMDIAQVATELPARLRSLLQRLMSDSPSDIARKRGVARQRIAEDIARIRCVFVRRGITSAN